MKCPQQCAEQPLWCKTQCNYNIHVSSASDMTRPVHRAEQNTQYITTIFIVHYGNGWNVHCNMRSSSRTQNLRFAIVLGLTFTTVPENFWTSLNRRCTSPGQQNIHVLLQVRAIDERFDPELVLVDRPHDLCDEVARRQTEFIFATSCANNYTISSRGLCWGGPLVPLGCESDSKMFE